MLVVAFGFMYTPTLFPTVNKIGAIIIYLSIVQCFNNIKLEYEHMRNQTP